MLRVRQEGGVVSVRESHRPRQWPSLWREKQTHILHLKGSQCSASSFNHTALHHIFKDAMLQKIKYVKMKINNIFTGL